MTPIAKARPGEEELPLNAEEPAAAPASRRTGLGTARPLLFSIVAAHRIDDAVAADQFR
jgi:hypothetical protein